MARVGISVKGQDHFKVRVIYQGQGNDKTTSMISIEGNLQNLVEDCSQARDVNERHGNVSLWRPR